MCRDHDEISRQPTMLAADVAVGRPEEWCTGRGAKGDALEVEVGPVDPPLGGSAFWRSVAKRVREAPGT